MQFLQSAFRIYTYRKDFYFVDWFHGSALHGGRCVACCEAHMNFSNESACLMADNVQNEGRSYFCSQIIGVENAVPLQVDIPRTSGRGSDLSFLAFLEEYLQFPYGYFLSVLLFRVYCSKFCPSNNPRRKKHKDYNQVNVLAKYHC
jgi:hypothetical protein